MKKISNHQYPEKCKGLLILSVYFMLSYYMHIFFFFFIFHYCTPCSIEGWLLPGTARYLFFMGILRLEGFSVHLVKHVNSYMHILVLGVPMESKGLTVCPSARQKDDVEKI